MRTSDSNGNSDNDNNNNDANHNNDGNKEDAGRVLGTRMRDENDEGQG